MLWQDSNRNTQVDLEQIDFFSNKAIGKTWGEVLKRVSNKHAEVCDKE